MLHSLADFITVGLLNISRGAYLQEAVSFFIYDTIKIFLLLAIIIFAVSYLRTYLPKEKVKEILSKRSPLFGHVLAALFGIITPFCTCSAVPLFMGFLEAGVPLGVTFSFLVSSPMVNEVAAILLLGLFGWKIALLYIASGLVIAILSGIIIGRFKPENFLTDLNGGCSAKCGGLGQKLKQRERILFARNYAWRIIKKVWPYIIVGIGLGAWIHGYVPADFLAQYAGKDKWYAVPLAVLAGIPLYSNAAGVIPLVTALVEKGVSMGTALAFMMAVTALSFPEFLILKKIIKTKLLVIFAAVVGLGIMLVGLLFNAII